MAGRAGLRTDADTATAGLRRSRGRGRGLRRRATERPRRLVHVRAVLAERLAFAADAAVSLPAPFPAPYVDAWVSLVRARALIAATRLGLWDALPGDTATLAARCGCDPARLEVLMEALRALRYVRPGWRATRRARGFAGLEATVGELCHANWEVQRGLEDVLRGGTPPGLHDGVADPEVFAGYQRAMVELGRLAEPFVLQALGDPRSLLDVGGGPGTFAAAVRVRWPACDVAVADFEDAAALGRGDVRYIAGDARTADLGGPYDVATVLNVLHNVDRAAGVELLRAAGRVGRRVVVLEIEGTGTQVGTLASLTFTAWMGARAWTGGQLLAMAAEAGLRDVRLRRPARLNGNLILTAAGRA